jgi:hypothetical protein
VQFTSDGVTCPPVENVTGVIQAAPELSADGLGAELLPNSTIAKFAEGTLAYLTKSLKSPV